MSDQTDIERIIDKYSRLFLTGTTIGDVIKGAVEIKDAEIARLKNAHESELEKGEARFVEMAESLESTREVLEEVNSHNEKTQEENLELAAEVIQLRARLAEADVELAKWKRRAEEKQKPVRVLGQELETARSRQIALESQCQRMRDALTDMCEYFGHPRRAEWATDESFEAASIVSERAQSALSAPLDLELLNRVRSSLEKYRAMGGLQHSSNCAFRPGFLDQQCTCGCDGLFALLKSISPAP